MAEDRPQANAPDPAAAPAAGPEPLDAAHVRRIARLAMLEPTDAQIESARASLSAVLAYMRRLESAVADRSPLDPRPTDADDASTTPGNALREDVPGPTLPRSAFLAIAPETGGPDDAFLRIPSPPGQGEGA